MCVANRVPDLGKPTVTLLVRESEKLRPLVNVTDPPYLQFLPQILKAVIISRIQHTKLIPSKYEESSVYGMVSIMKHGPFFSFRQCSFTLYPFIFGHHIVTTSLPDVCS
jgi:hypothetical protein